MATPLIPTIDPTQVGWGTEVADAVAVLGGDGDPVPLPYYANLGSLPAAASYDKCFALVTDATVGLTPVYSNGTSWVPLAVQAANQPDSVAEDVTGLVVDFNNLLAKLVAAGVMTGGGDEG